MAKCDLRGEKSSSRFVEMEASSSTVKQLSILDQVDMHVEAIQSLVKRQRKSLQGSVEDDNLAGGNSSSTTDIRYHAEKILKVLLEGKNSMSSALPSFSSQNIVNQADNASVDVMAVCDKALNNSVVLRTIMKHLGQQDLLRCRLVCKTWDEEATIQLLPFRFSHASFYWEDSIQKYDNETVGSLEEFMETFYGDPRRKFPGSDVHFNLSDDDTDSGVAKPDLSHFLSNYGHHIKHLSISSSYNSTPLLKVVRKIIFDWTPNLNSLNLTFPFYEDDPETIHDDDDDDDHSAQDGETQISTSALPFQQLQELELLTYSESVSGIVLERFKRLVKQILAAAPNLQKISDTDLCFTTEIVSSGKIKAVDRLFISTRSSFTVPLCVQFSRARPQLTSLRVNLLEFIKGEEVRARDIFSSLQRILESSRLTLKTLHLVHRLHFSLKYFQSRNRQAEYHQAHVAIPVMENLQDLTIYLWNSFKGGEGWLLPRGFSFQVVLPRLKSLSLEFLKNGDKSYKVRRTDNPFTNHFNSSTTLERLTIDPRFAFPLEWIAQTRDLYPNVRTLHLHICNNWTELPKICENIWKSWNTSVLEELKIKMNCSSFDRSQTDNFAELMDQALTGFDQHTCRKLRERPHSDNSQVDQGLERNSSIFDMDKLKLFKLAGDCSTGFPIFSRVSVIHAFEPMRRRQNLQVMIHGTKLEEMILHGNLDFWRTFTWANFD